MAGRSENYESIISRILEDYKINPIDLLNLNDGMGEINYLSNHKESYLRTIIAVDELYDQDEKPGIKILEIGSYLGIASIALSRHGYSVTAGDLEIYMRNRNLQKKYQDNHIRYCSLNLKDSLPFQNNTFNCIIMCETLEHLNFNPVPVLSEIRRILVPGGFLYISLPNLCSLENRMKMLKGESVHNPIDDFFLQLDPNCNFSVGLHWREYTREELIQLVKRTGFEPVKHTYFHPLDLRKLPVKFYIRSIWVKKNFVYLIKKLFPYFKSTQTLLSRKPF